MDGVPVARESNSRVDNPTKAMLIVVQALCHHKFRSPLRLSRSGDGLSGPITNREFLSHQSFAKVDMSSSKKSKTPAAPQLSEQGAF